VGFNPKIFIGNTQQVLNDFRERFNKKFNHYPATHATAGFVSSRVLFEQVLPKAGSDDPEAVRKAALAVDIPQGGTAFGFGVKFAPPEHAAAGQNLRAHPVLMQWQDQKMVVVHPAAFAVGQPLMPLPTWEQRGKGTTDFIK
jgi:branched-chain amino acid transport system substrate-binding protein